MRSLLLSLVLGGAALGLVAASPSPAQAQWRLRPYYSAYYYPGYSNYYTNPSNSSYWYQNPIYSYSYYSPPAYYGSYYYTSYGSYYYPSYSSYYAPRYYSGYYYGPRYYYGRWPY